MISHVKKMLAASLAVTVSLTLSACLKLNMDFTVNPGDTVSGSVVVALSKKLVEYGADASKAQDLYPTQDGIESKPFDDGEFVGTEYVFSAVPLEAFNQGASDTGKLQIVREGDKLITSGQLDFSSGSDSTVDLSMFTAGMDLRITITYPGNIVETNGTVDGQTVTWTPVYGEVTEINAVVDAPLTNPLLWVFIGAGVLVLAAIVVVVVMVLRKKKATEPVAKVKTVKKPSRASAK